MKTYDDLSTRQNEILTFIKKHTAKNNYPPSIREIASGVNLHSPATVHVHVKNLIEKGYLRRNTNNHKLLELLVPNEFEQISGDTVQIPLLGKVTAGNPIEAIENPDEYFPIPIQLIPQNSEIFTLRVSGESMINAGIHDNDIVIIERKNTAKNGDIVVAMTDENEVTLKTFYKEENYFRLQPENDFMTPIILNEVTILGKAIGLYRKF
ncbi:MAG: transcriptional repressor LexA [Bacilli bacterium]|nr:transcriptional repressor LexA [Bacilli bacterium]